MIQDSIYNEMVLEREVWKRKAEQFEQRLADTEAALHVAMTTASNRIDERDAAEAERDECVQSRYHLRDQYVEMEARAERAEAAALNLLRVVSSMPDAGLTADDPRSVWWFGPLYEARKVAADALETDIAGYRGDR